MNEIISGVLYAIIGVARLWFRSVDIWTNLNGDFADFHKASTNLQRSQITKVCLLGHLFVLVWPLGIVWSMLQVYFVGLATEIWEEEQRANHLPITQPAPPKRTATSAEARSPPPPYDRGGGNTVVV
ncbi:hypothetical protein QR685DRAFT_597712 [Neurospora intermedia]|uniref:Uncharacterized protein n=1 Tax=Neurospora intermedia TaxID=5142 RepID=A0ABR3DEX7_NEUIN